MTGLLLITAAILLICVALGSIRRNRRGWTRAPVARIGTGARKRPPDRYVPTALYEYLWHPLLAPPTHRRYIGIGADPAERHREHERKSWFPETTGEQRIVRWYDDWYQAHDAEVAAIAAAAAGGERLANDQHNPFHPRRRLRRAS